MYLLLIWYINNYYVFYNTIIFSEKFGDTFLTDYVCLYQAISNNELCSNFSYKAVCNIIVEAEA